MARNIPKCLQSGLVMRLNSSGIDVSGNGNNGTLVNAPTKVRVLQNDGLAYNGTSQSINLPLSIDSYFNGTNNYTFSVFAKSSTASVQFIYASGNNSVSSSINFGIGFQSNGKIEYIRQGGTTNSSVFLSNYSYNDGKFHMFCVTYNGQNFVLNIDAGREIITNTSVFSSYTNPGNPAIGYLKSGATHYMNGKIINPMIWNRALSAQEIQMLHKSLFIV